jgi:hypothetical protein
MALSGMTVLQPAREAVATNAKSNLQIMEFTVFPRIEWADVRNAKALTNLQV